MTSPGGWVNLSHIQPTKEAALLTGASDVADQVICFAEYLKFERDLETLKEIRQRFASSQTKVANEELKNANFRLDLRHKEDEMRALKKLNRKLWYIICGLFSLVVLFSVIMVMHK